MSASPLMVAHAMLKAYEDKNRGALEALIGDDFHFTSPLDNQLDRASYLARCWPNSATVERFQVIFAVESGEQAFVTYEATAQGHRFRNTEVTTARGGKAIAVEVYFGWDLPHKAAENGFIQDGDSQS